MYQKAKLQVLTHVPIPHKYQLDPIDTASEPTLSLRMHKACTKSVSSLNYSIIFVSTMILLLGGYEEGKPAIM